LSAGRILVVDASPNPAHHADDVDWAGYEIDDAKTGEEALEKVREYRSGPGAAGYTSSGMGGLAACRLIRADTTIAIFMLTSELRIGQSRGPRRRRRRLRHQTVSARPGASGPHYGLPQTAACFTVSPRQIHVAQLEIDFNRATVTNGAMSATSLRKS